MKKLKVIITGVLSGMALIVMTQAAISSQSIGSTFKASESESTVVQQDPLWISISIVNPALPDTNPANQRVEEAPTDAEPTGICSTLNTGQICSVKLDFSSADEAEVADLLDQLTDPMQPNPTIQNFLDTGAKHSGPGETPVYARLAN